MIYISPAGKGVGTESDPTSWAKAHNIISVGGTVYFTSGVYGNLGEIRKSFKIIGLGNVSLKDMKTTYMSVRVFASNFTIKNINFINLHMSTPVGEYSIIRWEGANGELINCTFINNQKVSTSSYSFEPKPMLSA